MLLLDRFGELLGEDQIRFARFAPHHIRISRVGKPARHRLIESGARFVEAFHRALASAEGLIVIVDVRRDQIRRFGVGASKNDGRYAEAIRCKSCCDELFDRLPGWHQYLTTHMPALFHRRELVFEVNAGGAGVDHCLHELECIQYTAEAGLGVGHDRRKKIDVAFALGVLDLISADEGAIDSSHHRWHRIHRIQRLVRIHFAGDVGVSGHLPAGEIDSLETSLDLLHRLIAGQRTQGVDKGLLVDEFPELFGAPSRQRVLDVNRAAEAHDVFRRVVARDPFPPRVLRPILLQPCRFEIVIHDCSHHLRCGQSGNASRRRGPEPWSAAPSRDCIAR